MNHLNYHQLYYFYKIADAGSLAKASKLVLISAPALSMQLKELEDQVGTPLFLRNGKGLELTETGHLVYDYAKDIFKLGQELKDTLSDQGGPGRRSKIEIGFEDSIPKSMIEKLVEFMFEKGAKVIVREASIEQLRQMQESFELDLILTHSRPNNHYDDTQIKRVFREQLIVVGTPAWKKIIESKKLAEVHLILNLSRTMSSLLIDKFWKSMNKKPVIIAEIEDHQMEVDLARKGHGVIISQPSTVARYIKEKKLVKIYDLPVTDEVWLVLGRRKKVNQLALQALEGFTIK